MRNLTEKERAVVKADFEAQLQAMQGRGQITDYSLEIMPWGANVTVSVVMPAQHVNVDATVA